MSAEEQAVQADLERVLRSPGADAAYDQVDGTFGGRLLNADLARELSRSYRGRYDRIAFTACTYAPCAAYVRGRFDRVIRSAGAAVPGERNVLFLAGGAASGKTRSMSADRLDDFDLVFDSNLAGFEKAREMIDAALAHGWLVTIAYIHRPYALALRGMIERADEDGRYIPIGLPSKLARLHFDAQRTVVRLRVVFPAYLVRILVLENLWTPDDPVPARSIPLADLDEGGRHRYTSIEELHATQSEILQDFDGVLEEGLFQALGETES